MTVELLQRLRELRCQRASASAPVRAVTPVAGANAATAISPLHLLEQLRQRLRQHSSLPPRAVAQDEGDLPGSEIALGVRYLEGTYAAPSDGPWDFPEAGMCSIPADTLLCIDTETTGLAGGTGTRAFVIGATDWKQGRLRLRQLLLTRLAGEPALLAQFAQWLADEPILVSYNGKSYDLPLLRTRWRLARQLDASAGLRHLDLLHTVRRRYRGVWENCRLATVERQLLQIQRDDDLPGCEAPQAFTDWLRHREQHNLRRVLAHNAQDLVSLAWLTARLGQRDACLPLAELAT